MSANSNDVIKLCFDKPEVEKLELMVKKGDFFKKEQRIAKCFEKFKDCKVSKGGNFGEYTNTHFFVKAPVFGSLTDYSKEDKTLYITPCKHDMLFGGICIACGYIGEQSADSAVYKSLSPDITFSKESAGKYVKNKVNTYLKEKKLILLLDLDNTILHTANNTIPEKEYINLKNKYKESIGLIDVKRPHANSYYRMVVKFRRHLKQFLDKVKEKYDIFVYTHGTKEYSVSIIEYVNVNFSKDSLSTQRMLSREYDDRGLPKIKSIANFFPSNVNMILVMDDRKDVWMEKGDNLLLIRPYQFFYDINMNYQNRNKKENISYYYPFDHDHILHVFEVLLLYVNKTFYETYEKLNIKKNVETIVNEKLSSIYNGMKFFYYQNFYNFNKKEPRNKDTEKALKMSIKEKILRFGGIFIDDCKEKNNADIILIEYYDEEDDIIKEIYNLNPSIPVLHSHYIEICSMFYYKVDFGFFLLSPQKPRLLELSLEKVFKKNRKAIDKFYECEDCDDDIDEQEKEEEEEKKSNTCIIIQQEEEIKEENEDENNIKVEDNENDSESDNKIFNFDKNNNNNDNDIEKTNIFLDNN